MVFSRDTVMPTNTSSGVVPGGLMYQTAQGGLVYATQQSTTTTLPEGVILNLGQEHSRFSLPYTFHSICKGSLGI